MPRIKGPNATTRSKGYVLAFSVGVLPVVDAELDCLFAACIGYFECGLKHSHITTYLESWILNT
jgi:hypothetical protein